jgi:diguanylate cyclase (GGDEF)-like protein
MVVGFLTRLLPACRGEIYVYANSRDVLDGCAGWAGGEPHDHIHPEDCWSLRRGRTYDYHEAEIGFPCGHVGHDDGRPYLCLPLLAHGETIGLLHLRPREGADLQDFRASRRLAQVCAEQISMAIANVRMRDELQDQSVRDSLTGLFNRRHLTDALRRYMARAARQDTSVALLSIDVDHFKKFNDNYGHDAGDMVLRAVGEVLDRSTDGDELACRPGGEEFMVVLPDTDMAEALHRAESIRERIQSIAIRYGEKTLPSISASIGIALSPADGTMPQDLMRAADEALYAAKADGRNRAVLTTLIGLEQEEGEDERGGREEGQAGALTAAE